MDNDSVSQVNLVAPEKRHMTNVTRSAPSPFSGDLLRSLCFACTSSISAISTSIAQISRSFHTRRRKRPGTGAKERKSTRPQTTCRARLVPVNPFAAFAPRWARPYLAMPTDPATSNKLQGKKLLYSVSVFLSIGVWLFGWVRTRHLCGTN
jgi:hypothetical protein